MSEAMDKDPAVMTPAEVAQKLWAIGHTEPLDIPTLMIWVGIACAKLLDKSRAIGKEYRARMNAVASALDDTFNPPAAGPKKAAFVLLLANFGDIAGGRVNYISNADRADVVAMLHEILARFEGRATGQQTDAKQ